MFKEKRKSGFTLVELLVALVVSAIVLAAAATMASVMNSASESSDDTAQQQARLRYTTVRIGELIRNCKMICNRGTDNIGLWRADDNGNGFIDAEEAVFIETNAAGNQIQLLECLGKTIPDPILFDIHDFQDGVTRRAMRLNPQIITSTTGLVRQCSNIEFKAYIDPPNSRFVSISFKMRENGIANKYQIDAYLRAWAGHLIEYSSGAYHIVSSDDDE